MAAPAPITSPSAPLSSSAPSPSPAVLDSAPSESPAAAPSPVEDEDREPTESPTDASPPSPAVSPSSNSLTIPPPPPLLASPPSVTAAVPAPPPPSSLNSRKNAPRPLSSEDPPSAPPPGDAPPPLLPPPSPKSSKKRPTSPPSPTMKAPKGSPQASASPPPNVALSSPSPPPLKPSFSSSPPIVSAKANALTEIHIAVTHSMSRFSTAIGIGVGSFIVLIFICLTVWCKCRRRQKISSSGRTNIRASLQSHDSHPTSIAADASVMQTRSSAPLIGTTSSRNDSTYSSPKESDELRSSRSWFTFEELGNATNWFSAENLLGERHHVYKGGLPDGREVAIKQQPADKDGATRAEQEFTAELEILSRVHHRHLVSLVGYCITDDSKFLVYDYVPNNTLYFHLHDEGGVLLDWGKRVRIAVGVARGIAYLHEDCCPRIIHRDIKSSNILLDHNFEAWVSDFGLAKITVDANTHITTRIMGTFGYVSPEYALTGKLTEQSDVYSFGVVLLELITGKKPIDVSRSLRDDGQVEWARPLLVHALKVKDFTQLIDPRLDTNYVESEMLNMIEVVDGCLQHSGSQRPRMGQVVRAFNNVARVDLMNGMRLGESEMVHTDEQSREIETFRRVQLRRHGYDTEYFSITSFQ